MTVPNKTGRSGPSSPLDHPAQAESPENPLPVRTLVSDLRAHRDLLEEQARELSRLEEAVLAAAAQESRQIVTAAAADVRRILRDARRELLIVAAQVQEATGRDLHDLHAGPPSPLGRRIAQTVLDAARPEIEAFRTEASAIRASLTPPLTHFQPDEAPSAPPAAAAGEAAADIELLRPASDLEPLPSTPAPAWPPPVAYHGYQSSPLSGAKTFVVAFASVCVVLLAGSWWWLQRAEVPARTLAPIAATPNPTPPVTSAVVPPSSPQSPPAWLVVETRRRVWLRIRVDNAPDPGAIVESGARREITSGENVVIRAGDAGAVLVSVNGGETTPLGSDGVVTTRAFSSGMASGERTSVPAAGRETEQRPTVNIPQTQQAAPVRGSSPPNPSDGNALSAAPPVLATESTPEAAPVSADLLITEAAARWMSAYFAQDAAAMRTAAGGAFSLADERTAVDKRPSEFARRRVLDQVKVLVVGTDAVYTARMRETSTGSDAGELVSLVSIVCERINGSWRLISVQITPEAVVRDKVGQSLSGPAEGQ
jgi:hypothetical protein